MSGRGHLRRPASKPGIVQLSLYLLRATAILGSCALVCIPAMLIVPFMPLRGVATLGKIWGRVALPLCGIELEVQGAEHVEPGVGHLIMANHTSHLDVLALYAGVPAVFRFVAKRELTYIPVFGWILAAGAAFIVDRRNRRQAFRSIDRARASLQKGQSVLFFPEGTRTPVGQLGPLKKGPFHMAVGAHAKVLPVAVTGAGQILEKGSWFVDPGKITVTIFPPIDTSGFTEDAAGRDALKDQVQAILEDAVRQDRPTSA